MTTTPAFRPCSLLVAVALLADVDCDAVARDCKTGSAEVTGTLAAPHACPPPAANTKSAPKKVPRPDGFWPDIRIGGSVSATTTIRGR
jgi:hypothetical protein